jgi:hypothetical protein
MVACGSNACTTGASPRIWPSSGSFHTEKPIMVPIGACSRRISRDLNVEFRARFRRGGDIRLAARIEADGDAAQKARKKVGVQAVPCP